MGYGIQDQNENASVKVNAGNYQETGAPQTDFIITEPGSPNEHRHIVIDQFGDQVYDQWNPNK